MIHIYLTYPLLLLVEFKKGGKIILYSGVGKIYYKLEYFDWRTLRLRFLVNVCLFILFFVKFSGVGSSLENFLQQVFFLVLVLFSLEFWLELRLDLVWLVESLLQLLP